MKKLSIIAVCCFLMFAGCKRADIRGKNTIDKPEYFPDVMVGRWEAEAEKFNWMFEFQPDGSILKMNHAMAGEVDLTDGEAYIEKDKPALRMEYLVSPCKAKYDPATNEVFIEVIIGYYRIQAFDKVLEGSRTDIFRGALPEDGKMWKTELLSYLEIEGKKLKKDAVKPHPIVFNKTGTP